MYQSKCLSSGLFWPLLRLKGRTRDLNKPLRIVNRTLWEEMKNSSEKEVLKYNNYTNCFFSDDYGMLMPHVYCITWAA